ncbi:MAG: cob(I)yrinic acid a,c-diamide adenosyltransferase [Clostridia bacterium]|nr:cob(I)yrinic acid a,c-diamide adenosyltransferase [Clostridia bacterium]
MIQTYYGNGKGKTTAAIGAAIRAAGSGKKVVIVWFLKDGKSSECNSLKAVEGMDFLFPSKDYVLFEKQTEQKIAEKSKEYSNLLLNELYKQAKKYQMIVLDEVLDILEFGYVNESSFLQVLQNLKQDCEIVLTGHNISDGISDISDYLSQINEIKHPFKNGAEPRKGIEY